MREPGVYALSNEDMATNSPYNATFSLSEAAEQYLQQSLASSVGQMSERGLVTSLTYSGGYAPERDGKILWEYRGPNFLLAGQNPAQLGAGRYYDLLGYRVWIGEIEEILLRGKTLTMIQYGKPAPAELLVIKNAPEDYLEASLRARCGCAARASTRPQTA